MAKKILVQETEVSIININHEDYISLTDMLKAKDGDFFISDWLRNRNTIEFLGIWESVYNPDFNYGEYAIIRNQAGLNSYKISAKEWASKTKAIGLVAKAGRYGGTYAHKDIAFEFGMWISPEFKIYLIKEFQRLKQEEVQQKKLEWNVSRTLAKVNYAIHTDAVKAHLIPENISSNIKNFIYADEADLLNLALFGKTAQEWRTENPELKGNIRDNATLEQLVVLSNLESYNSELIKQKIPAETRLQQLNRIAIEQMRVLIENKSIKKIGIAP
ncbi:MAG: KilA-N domain-containing protein [SAR324 cluster bacterium]|nr:KilA-N domain-containing protein [SAR324 cluster bacterium]